MSSAARPWRPIMDRYDGRPDDLAKVEACWEAWQRLREMSLEPSPYAGKRPEQQGEDS